MPLHIENAPDDRPTLLLTLSGPDRTGVSRSLFSALTPLGAEVLDLEQVIVRGQITLSALVRAPGREGEIRALAQRTAYELGLTATVSSGIGDNRHRPSGRAVVTVLASPLQARHVAAVTDRIAEHGANIDRIRRLSRYPVTALEFDISAADLAGLRPQLAAVAAAERIDIAISAAGLARRGKRLVVMDVDSTLIRDEVIELLAEHAGRGEQVAAVTAAAMAGDLDFAESLRARVQALEGLPVEVFARVQQELRLTPGARTLVRTLKRLGFTVALVSGGFLEIVGPLAAQLGIDHARANRLEVRDGRLTGRLDGPIVDRAGKAAALREFAAAERLPLHRTVAIGDGANDLDMLDAAGLGIAFNAKPVVAARADTSVTVPYLDTVLYLLGITREEVEEADQGGETEGAPGWLGA